MVWYRCIMGCYQQQQNICIKAVEQSVPGDHRVNALDSGDSATRFAQAVSYASAFFRFGFFLLPNLFHARPQVTNANLWMAGLIP